MEAENVCDEFRYNKYSKRNKKMYAQSAFYFLLLKSSASFKVTSVKMLEKQGFLK